MANEVKLDERKPNEDLLEDIHNIDLTNNKIESIEKSLKDPQPIDDLDINVLDESLVKSIRDADELSSNLDPNVNSLDGKSKKEMQEIFAEQLRKLPPEKRNELLMNLAQLQQVNPNDRKFGSLDDKYRHTLLKKLHDRRNDLEMKRKTKTQILKIRDEQEQRMKQMMSNLKKNNDSQHIHDENCNHDKDKDNVNASENKIEGNDNDKDNGNDNDNNNDEVWFDTEKKKKQKKKFFKK